MLVATSTVEMGLNFPARQVIVYDSYFMAHHRTPRMIIQHGIDLGLLPPSTILPEETESKQIIREASSEEEAITLSRS